MNSPQLLLSEFSPYYQGYLNLVETTSINEAFRIGKETTKSFFAKIPDNILNYRYAEGKWTPKDILQHIIDTERVFAYRALSFARTNNADLEGFNENSFADSALAENKHISQLLEEYEIVRAATICLFKNFNHTELLKYGSANGSEMSVRAAGFIICGHEIHHCAIIKERYLK